MPAVAAELLLCPVCRQPLVAAERSFVCAQHHAFDRAREGYVNLLRTKRTGDSKEMLLARRAFLDRGHYQPLAHLICLLVHDYLDERARDLAVPALLDAGCGEGYYLAQIMQDLSGAAPCVALGLDSAKDAVRLAARRCPGAFFVVADIHEQIPFVDHSLQVLLNIFAPRQIAEFTRVLAPGGMLLTVIPAPQHLVELRERLGLLSIEEQKLERLLISLDEGFTALTTQSLDHTMRLGDTDILHLIQMTPNNRHTERWSEAAIAPLVDRPISAAFTVVTGRRR